MNDLKPIGEEIVLDGQTRHLLFDFNVIYTIQQHFDEPINDSINRMIESDKKMEYLQFFLYALLQDEYERTPQSERENLKEYSLHEIGWMIDIKNERDIFAAVLRAYGISLPDKDEFESPNVMSAEQKK